MNRMEIEGRMAELRQRLTPQRMLVGECPQMVVEVKVEGKPMAVPVWIGSLRLPPSMSREAIEIFRELGRLWLAREHSRLPAFVEKESLT